MYDVRRWPAILTVLHASKKIVSVEFLHSFYVDSKIEAGMMSLFLGKGYKKTKDSNSKGDKCSMIASRLFDDGKKGDSGTALVCFDGLKPVAQGVFSGAQTQSKTNLAMFWPTWNVRIQFKNQLFQCIGNIALFGKLALIEATSSCLEKLGYFLSKNLIKN
uniref:Uncharacterized protein n=1 Tax=Romanomermis culicivorax TaxID=13658 RepID=A0A915JXQ1_ROMCU